MLKKKKKKKKKIKRGQSCPQKGSRYSQKEAQIAIFFLSWPFVGHYLTFVVLFQTHASF
jgi:hypothetical protein